MHRDLRGLSARLDRLEGNSDEAAMEQACAQADAEYQAMLAAMGVEVLPGESAFLLLLALLLGGGIPCPADNPPLTLPARLRDYWEKRVSYNE